MKLSRYQYFQHSLLFCLIVLSFSCTDKPSEEKLKTKIVSPPIEETFYIESVFEKSGHQFVSVDMIEYSNSIDSPDIKQKNKIELPNSYYIINENIELTEMTITDSVDITMQTLSHDNYGNFKFNEKISFLTFMKIYNSEGYERYRLIPFRITHIRDEIISIDEIYIP